MALKLQIMLFLLFPLLGMAQTLPKLAEVFEIEYFDYTAQSPYTFEQTIERLQEILKSKGITVFATIDHQAAAKAVGEKLAPATVLIVGNPKIGTALMQENPRFAIELPLKILIYEENKTVNIRYEKIAAIAEKYHIKQNFATAEKIDTAMLQLIKSSISK
ncbi:DUF302 domain-containing protein [Capnocytophaga sp. oral taxon 326]|uniref:DUF302 domain-containing protein n=1 Tax=Capnocytophaga sp. oral taxon 326 TaxID=712212 RepID=UPI0002A2CC20|nr:DUF302 domain-containing protein [Capnocytophaga sp. oral taxon 326]EKY14941.1 hypothetical protein HMPREF9073_02223 [Capnocytophaga sp. oral taxon 326 str. F0382]